MLENCGLVLCSLNVLRVVTCNYTVKIDGRINKVVFSHFNFRVRNCGAGYNSIL